MTITRRNVLLGATATAALLPIAARAQASEVVRTAWSNYKGKDNPDLRLLDLDKVVALIEADFPTKLYYVPLRNSLFDTHVNQQAQHQRLLQLYSEGITAFVEDLDKDDRMKDVLIMTFSEFGRRVAQNASGGTDHGTANNLFVVTKHLKQKGFLNNTPDLLKLDNGDLINGMKQRSARGDSRAESQHRHSFWRGMKQQRQMGLHSFVTCRRGAPKHVKIVEF